MAFSKAPSQSTYQDDDVKLIYELNNRDATGTKDTLALNGFFEVVKNKQTQDNEYWYVKRDGTSNYVTAPSSSIRGMYYWKDQDKLFLAYSDKIAVYVGSTGVLSTTLTPWVSTTGTVGFTEFQYASGVVKLVAADGTKIITIDTTNTVVVGADADQPAAFDPNVIYLDGYLFLVKSSTADIYNSNLDDPLAFTAGDFITAEMIPDSLVRIGRLNNYILAFGTASIEYFYDAGNASGSPLNRNDTPVKFVGYLGGLATHQNKLYFVGKVPGTNPEVYQLEDFKMKTVDNPPLRRYVEPYSSFTGNIISYGGKDFYVVTVGGITYQLDMETELWTRLSQGANSTFPITFAVNLPYTGIGNVSVVAVSGSANLVMFVPTVYQDSGVNFTMQVRTENFDFDTQHRKTMSRVLLKADQTTASSLITLAYSDDDYKTWSADRTMDLVNTAPFLKRFGQFRQRAFRLTYNDNYPCRLKKLEVQHNIGVS